MEKNSCPCRDRVKYEGKRKKKTRRDLSDHYSRPQVPTTVQSQRAPLKRQCKPSKGCGQSWVIRWGKLECHQKTFELCLLLTHLSESLWVSIPLLLGGNIKRWRKLLTSKFILGEHCVYLHKISVEKLFGLEVEIPPDSALLTKDEC